LEENSLRRLTSFQKLKKKELDEELEARSIEITEETKPKLVEHLNDILHSICRPTTFMLKSPTQSSKELYIDDYEILGLEPLHDITNIIQQLIEELPYNIENLEARQDLEKNASNIIGEKPNEGIRCPALCCKISKVYYHET
jgi:predicted house-cleaning noncanonical NTP pyrophosphatase (MazG superfamily)